MFNGRNEIPYEEGYLSENDDTSLDLLSDDEDDDEDANKPSGSIYVQTTDSKRARVDNFKTNTLTRHIKVPERGTLVKRGIPRSVGPFIIGSTVGFSPVRSIVQCLARKEGTNQYYTVKILTLTAEGKEERKDVKLGKMLLHNEYSLLSLLTDQQNVIHHHGLFRDYAIDEKLKKDGFLAYTGRVRKRFCLVLDCLVAHEYYLLSGCYVNLQQYVIKQKKLKEREALTIFHSIVTVIHQLHERNIVHRDLKLGNFVLNLQTYKVTLTNFCLGKQLSNENDLLTDQRGSPAYISPDVLSNKPYKGKPSDMWAVGVVLYTMLFGHFPFYDPSPSLLFNKIKAAEYAIPVPSQVSYDTVRLITNLLVLDTNARFTASQLLLELNTMIAISRRMYRTEPLQVVPEYSEKGDEITKDDPTILAPLSEKLMGINNLPRPLQSERKGPIPVHTVGEDARELNMNEWEELRDILNERNLMPIHLYKRQRLTAQTNHAGNNTPG